MFILDRAPDEAQGGHGPFAPIGTPYPWCKIGSDNRIKGRTPRGVPPVSTPRPPLSSARHPAGDGCFRLPGGQRWRCCRMSEQTEIVTRMGANR